MPELTHLTPDTNAKAKARDALAQMYGYYAFDWQPFSPGRQPPVKDRA